jgi:hypothetical protein
VFTKFIPATATSGNFLGNTSVLIKRSIRLDVKLKKNTRYNDWTASVNGEINDPVGAL